MFIYVMFMLWGRKNKTSLIHVNISFIASDKPLKTNENSRELSRSAVKFCLNLRKLQRNIVGKSLQTKFG